LLLRLKIKGGTRMMNPVSIEHGSGVASILANNPPVNSLSEAVRNGLVAAVDAASISDAEAIMIACEGRTFFSGADISELDQPLKGADLLQFEAACARAGQPILAAMHGHVYGGGVVIGYCADMRVAAPGTRFAMPEIRLGLLATFGGTQILPRLIGIEAATKLLVGATSIDADEAVAIGLIDAIVAQSDFHAFAKSMLKRSPGKRRARKLEWSVHDQKNGAALIQAALDRHTLENPEWQAPLATLSAMKIGFEQGIEKGLSEEARLFEQLKTSRQSAVLRRLFFAERALSKDPPEPSAITALQDAAGPRFDINKEQAQRSAIQALGWAAFGSPDRADAAVVTALNWPIWKADIFLHEPGFL
jgi:enoyl-CoA hydratase/carnithine racemase